MMDNSQLATMISIYSADEVFPEFSASSIENPQSTPDILPCEGEDRGGDRRNPAGLGVKRRLFTSTPTKKVRTQKSIAQIRAKRKRYRNRKKDLIRLQLAWKERTEAYEKGIEDDMAVEANRMQLQAKTAEQQEFKKNQQVLTRCEDMQKIEQSYHTIETDSMQDDTGILLLPSVSSVPCQITIPCDITTAVEKTYVASCIEDIRTERDKALRDTLLYRNIAEQLRREKRVLHNKLTRKCETIRDFWRNNLVEGCTRGGRMVREALFRKH